METTDTIKQEMLKRAAYNFMTTQITVRKWAGVKLAKKASAKAAEDAGAKQGCGRLNIDLLGSGQPRLKEVNSAYDAVRTYLTSETHGFENSGKTAEGKRLINTNKVPAILAEAKRLTGEAEALLSTFLADYDLLVSDAKANDLGNWNADATHPARDEIASKFEIILHTPEPLSIPDAASMSGLPASTAAEYAAEHAAKAYRQLEFAKQATLKSAAAQLQRVVTQLESGQRLAATLISGTAEQADMLREIAAGTDNDPRLLELAEMMTTRVANVSSTDEWKDCGVARDSSLTGARVALKGVQDLQSGFDELFPAPAPAAGAVELGGAMADLW
jgi:hypothetical protein